VEAFSTVDCSPLKIPVQGGIVSVTHMLPRIDGLRGSTDLPYNEYWRLTRGVKRPEYEADLTCRVAWRNVLAFIFATRRHVAYHVVKVIHMHTMRAYGEREV
jgi:hypothetical protein